MISTLSNPVDFANSNVVWNFDLLAIFVGDSLADKFRVSGTFSSTCNGDSFIDFDICSFSSKGKESNSSS